MTTPDTTPEALRALAKEVDALIVDWDRREIRERAVATLLAIAEKMETHVDLSPHFRRDVLVVDRLAAAEEPKKHPGLAGAKKEESDNNEEAPRG
jgi:hypothetical protein